MKFTELKRSLDSGEIFPVYLIEGEDSYFRDSAVKELKEKFVVSPEINFVNFDGNDADLGDFAASLFALPFMSPKRITAIKEYYPKTEQIKGAVLDYLNNPPADSLLLVVNQKPCESLKKFQTVCAVSCEKADAITLSKWIVSYFKQGGAEISFDVAKEVAEYCRCDMTRIKNESDKLIGLSCGKAVDIEIVKDNVYRDADYKVYEMTDFIAKKDFSSAVAVVQDMLDKGEPPQKITVSIYNYFRRLLFINISGMTESQLAEYFGIKEFAVKKAGEQAKRIGARALKKAVDCLTEADFSVKNGKMEEYDAMWLNLFKIMAE